MIGQHRTFLAYCISCAVTWSQESYKLATWWPCVSGHVQVLTCSWNTNGKQNIFFLTPKLITYNVLDIHVAVFQPVLFLLYRALSGGGRGIRRTFKWLAEPLLRQQFLLISKEGKNRFILIISEISRYRIEISQDSCHRPKTTSIQYQQQN